MAFSAAAEGISIHAPGWGATRFLMLFSAVNFYFNPRTRVGCDLLLQSFITPAFQISIHAPGWGATKIAHIIDQISKISIHAPGWGATMLGEATSQYAAKISIHAPGWGATTDRDGARALLRNFNPRTRVGCDCLASGQISLHSGFQSTHPGGVRPAVAVSKLNRGRFQSTHPGGVRPLRRRNMSARWRFQSTHPGGVRRPLFL